MNLIHTVILYTATAFLDYSVSKVIEKVGEFETSGGAITSTDSRHLKSL
jgi:hypothetical protein